MNKLWFVIPIFLSILVVGCNSENKTQKTSLNSSELINLQKQVTELQEVLDAKNITIEEFQKEIVQKTEQISDLEQQIMELQKEIAEFKTVTLPPSQPTIKQWEIISIDAKITEKNDIWWKYSWILIVKNNNSYAISVDAIIEFLDNDGFVVDDTREYDLLVEAETQKTFTGYDLVLTSIAPNIKNVKAKLEEN